MNARVITTAIGLVTVLWLVAAQPAAQSADPFVGTWRLNVAKSKYTPGPIPKSVTSTYEPAGKGDKVSVRNEPASGALTNTPTRQNWTAPIRK
jgi:hypothetical protein